MTISINANALMKSYGPVRVVDQVSFNANQGDVVGFLGPNGAGKTTMMRMLTGFLTPDSGSVEICGLNLEKNPLKAKTRLGYLPEGAPLYADMTVADFLWFIGRLRDINASALIDRLDKVIETVHLDSVLNQRIENLSKGYKRRVGIAQAILHDPDVLIMDEPTDGLDPSQKMEVRQLIREMAQHKVIILSTHILEEVEAVCNRVLIIAGGRILVDQTPQALIQDQYPSLESAFLSLIQGQQART